MVEVPGRVKDQDMMKIKHELTYESRRFEDKKSLCINMERVVLSAH